MPAFDEIKGARRAIREFRRVSNQSGCGPVTPEAPTPERLAQVGAENFEIEEFNEIAIAATVMSGRAVLYEHQRHMRVAACPLEQLKRRQLLAPDVTISVRGSDGRMTAKRVDRAYENIGLAMAGERYYSLWAEWNQDQIGSSNFEFSSSAGLSPSFFKTLAQLDSWQRWKAAREAIYKPHQSIVDDIILAEIDLLETGRKHTAYTGRDTAIAVALDRLRLGLAELAHHFGVLRRSEALAAARGT